MAEDRVDITADASQYFDVLARAGSAANRFATSGTDIGNGFLRSERTIARASSEITRNLLVAGDAGQALDAVLLGLQRVAILPLAGGLAVGATVALLRVFHDEGQKTKVAYDALRRELDKPLSLQISLSPADINTEIEAITKSVDELRKRQTSPLNFLVSGFARGTTTGVGSIQGEILAGEQRLFALANARGDAELRIVAIKETGLQLGKLAEASAKAEADFASNRAKLLSEGPATTVEFLAKALEALERTRAVDLKILEIERARQAIHQTLVGQEARIQVGAAQAAIGAGPEAAQRIGLESEIALRQQAFKAAADTFAADTKDVTARNALTQSVSELGISKANLAKFDNQTAFANEQRLKAAVGEAEQIDLQTRGQTFLAEIAKIRLDAELKIAATLRDQTASSREVAAAEEAAATAKLQQAVGKQTLLTAPEIIAQNAAANQAAFERAVGESRIRGLEQDVEHGAILDDASQRILDAAHGIQDAGRAAPAEGKSLGEQIGKGIVDELSRLPTPAGTEPGGPLSGFTGLGQTDFSSLVSAGQADYSNLTRLGQLDFSGIETLSGITISIA